MQPTPPFTARPTAGSCAPSLFSVLRGLAYELRADWNHVQKAGGIGALWRAPALRAAQVLGQYMGARRDLILDPNLAEVRAPKGDQAL